MPRRWCVSALSAALAPVFPSVVLLLLSPYLPSSRLSLRLPSPQDLSDVAALKASFGPGGGGEKGTNDDLKVARSSKLGAIPFPLPSPRCSTI